MLSKYLKTLGNGFGMWIASYTGMETKKVIEISREKLNQFKRQGKAISLQGQNCVLINGEWIPVKITNQINYKKRGEGSFSLVKIEGI